MNADMDERKLLCSIRRVSRIKGGRVTRRFSEEINGLTKERKNFDREICIEEESGKTFK